MGNLAESVMDLFYPPPPTCPFCGRINRDLAAFSVCSRCIQQLSIIEKPICNRCGRPIRGQASEPCLECRGTEHFYQLSRSVGLYRDYLRTLILALKYHGRPELGNPLGQLLAARLEGEASLRRVDGIIPVPLHPERGMRRGYNQAELIAIPAAKRYRIPLLAEVVERERRTELQSKLTRDARHTNVAGAFRVSQPGLVRGKRLLVVDDIMTTGYTASECAKVLLAAGASWIGVITLAVGLIEEQWLDTEEPLKEW